MIRVALVTTWNEECGVFCISENIVNHRASDVEYKIIGRPWSKEQILSEAEGCQIIHFSYESNLYRHISPDWIHEFKNKGWKVVCTFHNIWPDDGRYPVPRLDYTRKNQTVRACDAVVVPDPVINPEDKNFVYIPQGILLAGELSQNVEQKIGIAGFPQRVKGQIIVAEIARDLGLGMLMFAPKCRHTDETVVHEVRQILPSVEVIDSYLKQQEVIYKLSSCAVTFWGYRNHPDQSGIATSVRMGLAARRPLITTRCGMYRDIFPYEDEVYFVPSDTPTLENALPVVREALKAAKIPNRIVEDMAWPKCGDKYAQVYRGLLP